MVWALMTFSLILWAYIYAEWISCSGPFPGTCTKGGCFSPQKAEDCILYGCYNVPGVNVECGYYFF